MKITRLLEITILLLSHGSLTARELAERFGVSTRTIYRDVDVLSSAGVPIYMSQGKGGGISLLENYTLTKAFLPEQESGSLLLALKTLQATQYPEIDKILNKLNALFHHTATNDWADVDFSYWGSHPNERDKFNKIKHAIMNQEVISFDYVNANGTRSSRAVEPLKLYYKGNCWYLNAYCRKRNSHCLFRISKIKNVITTTESFIPKQLTELEEEVIKSPPPMISFRLKFSDKVLNRLYDDFDDAHIIKKADGTLEVTVAFPENEWLYGYLLSYGHFVEVLEPPHVRNILIERMKEALKKYEDLSQI